MSFYKEFDLLQGAMIDSIKSILFDRHNEIFDRADFDNDDIYLEPLLYSYLHQEDKRWLDAVIYGYEKQRKPRITVQANSFGVIYLPQVGYLKTQFPGAAFVLTTEGENIKLTDSTGDPVAFLYEPLLFLNSGFQVIKHLHPLLEKQFQEQNLFPAPIDFSRWYHRHVGHLDRSLALLSQTNPDHYENLKKCLKGILIFSGKTPNSFSVFSAHNLVFLNADDSDNELFFLDHLSHEGAHVTFNTITYGSKLSLFTVDHNTWFSTLSGDTEDQSSLYLRFHGLFTFYEILKSLEGCLKLQLQEGLAHETLGRLLFQLRRSKFSIESFLKIENILTSEGKEWFDFFTAEHEKIERKFVHLIDKFNLSMPTYDFNRSSFLEKNPVGSVNLDRP